MRDLMLTRRRLLFSAGAGVLGVTVLNTVTGCTSSPEKGSAATPPSSATPSGAAPSDATPSGAAPAGAVAGDWRRVELDFVSAYLLIRGSEVAVVDLGTDGSAGAIEAALKGAGSGWGSVKHVILTHQHPDHAGGLAGVAPQVDAAFYAGAADLGSITSTKALRPVKDGDEIFGLQIVGTPGHTAGHVSVFDPSTGVLVAGDAVRNQNGVLVGSDRLYTDDAVLAVASVRKLAALDVKAILPGHGEPLTTGAADALRRLAATG
ncbi:MBL fold metallo-hydrolase [Micromonosporaceae bacterium Da 78-11]